MSGAYSSRTSIGTRLRQGIQDLSLRTRSFFSGSELARPELGINSMRDVSLRRSLTTFGAISAVSLLAPEVFPHLNALTDRLSLASVANSDNWGMLVGLGGLALAAARKERPVSLLASLGKEAAAAEFEKTNVDDVVHFLDGASGYVISKPSRYIINIGFHNHDGILIKKYEMSDILSLAKAIDHKDVRILTAEDLAPGVEFEWKRKNIVSATILNDRASNGKITVLTLDGKEMRFSIKAILSDRTIKILSAGKTGRTPAHRTGTGPVVSGTKNVVDAPAIVPDTRIADCRVFDIVKHVEHGIGTVTGFFVRDGARFVTCDFSGKELSFDLNIAQETMALEFAMRGPAIVAINETDNNKGCLPFIPGKHLKACEILSGMPLPKSIVDFDMAKFAIGNTVWSNRFSSGVIEGRILINGTVRLVVRFQNKFKIIDPRIMPLMVTDMGVPYLEACQLFISGRSERHCVPNGYWQNENTARNYVLAVLDSLPGFLKARGKGDVAAMAEIYRKHVINYRDPDNGTYGGQNLFFRKMGVQGLWGVKRTYLAKTSQPLSLLRLAVPEILDLNLPGALKPWEVERTFFNHEDSVCFFIRETLDAIPGFKDARIANNIKDMAALYRSNVSNYPGGHHQYFIDKGNLNGIFSKKSFLERNNSTGAYLRKVFPGLIDEDNPDALAPHEVEHGWWNSRDYAVKMILRALDSNLDGFYEARLQGDKQKMAAIYREKVKNYKRGQNAFFREIAGLNGLFGKVRPYLDKVCSAGALIELAVPGIISETDPNVLHPKEVYGNYWNRETAISQILASLDKLKGFAEARSAGDHKKAAEIYMKEVVAYRGNTPGERGQKAWFAAAGLYGLISSKRDFLDKTNSPAACIRLAYPELEIALKELGYKDRTVVY